MGDSYAIDEATIAEYLAPLYFFLLCLVVYGIRSYAKKPTFTVDVYASCAMAYFCSFGILVLVPLDLALAIIGRRDSGAEGYDENVQNIEDIYATFFSLCFVLYTAVIVLQQYYIDSGHFTAKDRVVDGIKAWGLMTAASGVVGLAVLILVVAGGYVDSGSASKVLGAVAVSVSNTVGLVAIVLLLGYALVEYPRSIFISSQYHEQLHKIEMRFAAEVKRLQEARLDATQTVADAYATKDEVDRSCDPILMGMAEKVISDCPAEFTSKTIGNVRRGRDGSVGVKELATLRQQVNWNRSYLRATERNWETLAMEAFYLQDVLKSERESTIQWSPLFFHGERGSERQRDWIVKWRPRLLAGASFVATIMSIFVLLGQVGLMAGYRSGVSVWSTALHDDSASGAGIMWFALFTLGFLCALVFWSLFQVRLTFGGVSMMEIIPEQQTTGYSMLMNAYLCTRLAPPLAFYYLSLVFESGIVSSPDEDGRPTAFARFYGQNLEVVPFIGDNFTVFFPVLILAIAALQLANVLNRFFVAIRMPQLQFGDELVDETLLMEGKKQLARFRSQKERAIQRKRNAVNRQSSLARRSSFSTGFGLLDRAIRMVALRRQPLASEDTIADPMAAHAADEESPALLERRSQREPLSLKVWCEKKGSSRFNTGGHWHSRLLAVQTPGVLAWYKDEDALEPNCELSMQDIVHVDHHRDRKGVVDPRRMDVITNGRDYKFRFEDSATCDRWVDAIHDWKEHAAAQERLRRAGHKRLDDDEAKGDKAEQPRLQRRASDLLNELDIEGFDDEPEPTPLQGYLKKKSPRHSGWQDRWFQMDGGRGALCYYKTGTDLSQELGAIPLTEAEVQHTEGSEFSVRAGDRTYELMAKSPQEARYWVTVLLEWKAFAISRA